MPIKELIQYIAQGLVDNHHDVSVSATEGAQTTIFELKVAKEDMGQIIGKHGRTADSIRTILDSLSGKYKRRFLLEIIE